MPLTGGSDEQRKSLLSVVQRIPVKYSSPSRKLSVSSYTGTMLTHTGCNVFCIFFYHLMMSQNNTRRSVYIEWALVDWTMELMFLWKHVWRNLFKLLKASGVYCALMCGGTSVCLCSIRYGDRIHGRIPSRGRIEWEIKVEGQNTREEIHDISSEWFLCY